MRSAFDKELETLVRKHMEISLKEDSVEFIGKMITSLITTLASIALTFAPDNKLKRELLIEAVSAELWLTLEQGNMFWTRAHEKLNKAEGMSEEDVRQALRNIGINV